MKTLARVIVSSIFMVASSAIVPPFSDKTSSKTLAQDAQTPIIYPLVLPPVWIGSYAGFPTAEEACQHVADNDRGGRRVLTVDLLPPADSYSGPIFYGAICGLENWGGELTFVFCPYEHPPYDPYIHIGGTKGICVLSSVYENSKLAPYARNAAGELVEDAKNYAGTISSRAKGYVDDFTNSLKDRGFDAVDMIPTPDIEDIVGRDTPPSGRIAGITVAVVEKTAIEWLKETYTYVNNNLRAVNQDIMDLIDFNKEFSKNKKFPKIRQTDLPEKMHKPQKI